MAKSSSRYICQSCGASFNKWSGRCDACGNWNCLVEELVSVSPYSRHSAKTKSTSLTFANLNDQIDIPARLTTGIAEFDRVCGGGLVYGSVVLIGGDPGIGKSTLLLQVIVHLSNYFSDTDKAELLYISGEESIDQIQLRARRINLSKGKINLTTTSDVSSILKTLNQLNNIKVVIIDSIQTMYFDALDSAPGTVAQVRASAFELIQMAKQKGYVLILVGHVTKEGMIAGPKVLEHMVDCVLYFEGEQGHQYRILRTVKNRFGPTDEIGVFEMTSQGLQEVTNPSALFLTNRQQAVSGVVVFAGIEGTRPLLVEIQVLLSPSSLATPRRAVVGWDSGRLSMVVAVLEARCGINLGKYDIYLNIAGGLKIIEPAADLAVAMALLSSLNNKPVSLQSIIYGEVGLSGEIRMVHQAEYRLKEALKLGFTEAFTPSNPEGYKNRFNQEGLKIKEFTHIQDIVKLFIT
ncbi:MAG: DNA repair protein RadA [Alphaproteobacteria bacterium]|nr:DNA repair protein RadA [Alphaproteobacteria bacterium]